MKKCQICKDTGAILRKNRFGNEYYDICECSIKPKEIMKIIKQPFNKTDMDSKRPIRKIHTDDENSYEGDEKLFDDRLIYRKI